MKRAALITAVVLFLIPLLAQTPRKSEVFSSSQIQAQIQSLASQAAPSGGSGATLADYGSHKLQLSVRTKTGGAEIHAHFDDVMIVEKGSATLMTGGSLLNPTTGPDGESKGSGIRDGKSQTISAGDVITVNAGIPHQLIIPDNSTYSALVIKVREP